MNDTVISEVMREMGRKGGQSRAARMTPEERREAARMAARAPRPSRRKPATDPDAVTA